MKQVQITAGSMPCNDALPERRLIAAIVMQAILDASGEIHHADNRYIGGNADCLRAEAGRFLRRHGFTEQRIRRIFGENLPACG